MMGSVEIRTVYSGSTQIKAALVSRLSCDRVGTRFITRGVDDEGHVANYVETEQLLLTDTQVASHVQVRGSIPLFWEQPGVNVGSHKVKLSRGDDLSKPAFEKHFSKMVGDYQDCVILNLVGINLVGSKEGEASISTSFQEQQKKSSFVNLKHVLWDFHAEGGCKNLDKLWPKIDKEVEKYGYYSSANNARQCGVVRTNCMDCLDRTNSAQSYIGKKMLDKQLASLVSDVRDNAVRRLHDMYQQMWINNGNSLSNLYAGTGALSQGGSKLLDGARSAARTIQNNLLDKDKQEAFDVLVHGGGRISDFRDRAKLVLPEKFYYGIHIH